MRNRDHFEGFLSIQEKISMCATGHRLTLLYRKTPRRIGAQRTPPAHISQM
ncbi:hypothetical protein I4U23_005713 [Adineta vaga]|nr:hypothetical protein I4U23_005713 [Adineta vaga]